MVALWHRAGHYIFALWFLLSSIFYLLSSFFLAYSQPSQIGCLPYFHTWCGLSANLGCKSETYCMRLAENTGRKISPKIRHLRTIAQLCRTMSSQLRHVSTIGKKLLNSNISPTCPHNMVTFGPTEVNKNLHDAWSSRGLGDVYKRQGYVFAIKARIDNRKKLVKQQYLLYMSPQYGELRPTSG